MEVCLNLLPVTNYSISVTALRVRFTATIATHTGLPGTTPQPGQTGPVRLLLTPRTFHISSTTSTRC